MLGASDGASVERGVELAFIHLAQHGQLRSQREERGLESPLRCGGGIGVVGADIQTVIAAKDPVAQLEGQLLGDFVLRTVQLDGQVGDALVGVHDVRFCDCTGRASSEAQHAGPTEVGAGLIWLQVERRQ